MDARNSPRRWGGFVLALCSCIVACGGSGAAPTPPSVPAASASADAVAPPAPSGSAKAEAPPAPAASSAPTAPADADAAAPAGNAFAAHVDEAKLAKELGAENGKLLQIAKLSPKTHKSLLKNHLYTPLSECKAQPLSKIEAAPGVLPTSKDLKLQAKAVEGLKAAGALAKQRGMTLEVMSAHLSIKEAVSEWNRAIIEAALGLVKQATPDQKEKSFAGEARKLIDDGEGPKSWTSSPCDVGRLGGWALDVQLVALDAAGKRGAVLVKAGEGAERFTKEGFESSYWDKPKGKSFRTLTEIMSAGKFVRLCDRPHHFSTSPTQDETWRCKQDTESWDPPNRPIPAWQ